jgi:hypothetical protein
VSRTEEPVKALKAIDAAGGLSLFEGRMLDLALFERDRRNAQVAEFILWSLAKETGVPTGIMGERIA